MTRTVIVSTQAFGAGDAELGSGTYPDWTNVNTANAGNLKVTSGVVSGTFSFSPENGDGVAAAFWSGSGSFTDDQYAICKVKGIVNDSINVGRGVMCRGSGSGGTRTYFALYVYNAIVTTNYVTRLFKVVNGTYTNIASTEVAFASDDTVELECSGTSPAITLTAYRNGSEIAALTQTASVTGPDTGKPGLLAGDDGALPNGAADDFVAGNLTGGGGITFDEEVWNPMEQQTNPLTVSVW